MRLTVQGVRVNLPLLQAARLVALHYFRDPFMEVARVLFPHAFAPRIPYQSPTPEQELYFDSLHPERKDPQRWYRSGSFHEKARVARGAPMKPTEDGPPLGHGTMVLRDGRWIRVEKADPSIDIQSPEQVQVNPEIRQERP